MSRYGKLKIMIAVAFVFFTIMLVTQLFGFLRTSFSDINRKKDNFDCAGIQHELETYNYDGKQLIIEVSSLDYNQNISKVTVISDSGDSGTIEFNPIITGREARKASIQDITIEQNYRYYINNCEDVTYEKKI